MDPKTSETYRGQTSAALTTMGLALISLTAACNNLAPTESQHPPESTNLPDQQLPVSFYKFLSDPNNPDQRPNPEVSAATISFTAAAQKGELIYAKLGTDGITNSVGNIKNVVAGNFGVPEASVPQQIEDQLAAPNLSSIIEIKFGDKPIFIKIVKIPTVDGSEKSILFGNFGDGKWRQVIHAQGEKGFDISSSNGGVVIGGSGKVALTLAFDSTNPPEFNSLFTAGDPGSARFKQALYPLSNKGSSPRLVLRDGNGSVSGSLPEGLFDIVQGNQPVPTKDLGNTINISFKKQSLEVTPTQAEPTATTEVLTPEQQLAEYVKTAEAKQSIDQFVNAMKMAGIELTAEQVSQGITFKELKDKDGNPFTVGVYNLDPDLSKTGEALEGPIPIAIAEKNEKGEWGCKDFSTRFMADLSGVLFGTTVDGTEDFRNPLLQQALKSNFSIMTTNGQLMPFVVDKYGWEGGKSARKIAGNDLILYLHPGFYPRFFPENLKNASKEVVDQYIDDYLDNYLSLVKKTDEGYQPTLFNIVNEAVWSYKGNIGWYTSNENPLYRIYKEDWIAEVYTKAYQKAIEKGLTVGKDVVFIYNDSDLTHVPKKAALVHSVLTKTKSEISRRLGITPDEVQLDVGIELHLSEEGKNIPP